MKYKFIGTEQDLIDNGFDKVIEKQGMYVGSNEIENMFQLMLCTKENHYFEVFIISNNYIDGREVVSSDIQDLIDKGLVVEV